VYEPNSVQTIRTDSGPGPLNGVDVEKYLASTQSKEVKRNKSTAWTLTYRSVEKTLETAEVDATHTRILAALEKALPVVVRK
jgi:phenylalanyl-tRNA synthetase beta subunit